MAVHMNKTNNNIKGSPTLTARSELSGPDAASQGGQIQISNFDKQNQIFTHNAASCIKIPFHMYYFQCYPEIPFHT